MKDDGASGKRAGKVQVYTGDGKGKTTAAFGLALRTLGSGMTVYICQFLKGRPTGEVEALNRFGDRVRIDRFGRDGFVLPDKVTDEDRRLAQDGFEAAIATIRSGDYNLAILDEIGPACELGLIRTKQILELIRNKPPGLELVLTGRAIPPEVIAAADLVTEMVEKKHYYRDGTSQRPGIEY